MESLSLLSLFWGSDHHSARLQGEKPESQLDFSIPLDLWSSPARRPLS